MEQRTSQSGQILLISLLVLSVATTIALSLIGRAAVDQNISNEIEESARALAGAEAGIEQSLKSSVGSGGTQVLTPSVSYTANVSAIGSAAGPYAFPQKSTRNSTETLWLVNHNSDGTLNETPTYTASTMDICWSSETTTPAVVATVLYKKSTDGSYRTAKGAFDPDGTRAASNKFTAVGASGIGCGGSAYYKTTLNFTSLGITPILDTLLMLRLRPVYSGAQLAVNSGGAILPIQGNRIDSTGSVATGVTRKVVVLQQYRSAESIFDAVVFSQGTFGH